MAKETKTKNPALSAESGPPKKSWTSRLLYLLLGIASAAVLGTVLVFGFGSVSGVQIDPTSFASRDFRFYCIPFSEFQISPTMFGDPNTDLENALTPYLDPNRSRKRTWEVSEITFGTRTTYGNVRVVDNLFAVHHRFGSTDDRWSKWSDDHPKIAKLFWPLISDLAQNDAYSVMPEFIDDVRYLESVDQFNEDLIPSVISLVLELADDQFEAAEFEKSRDLSELVTRYDTTIPRAYKLLGDSYQELGDSAKADEMLRKSEELATSDQ